MKYVNLGRSGLEVSRLCLGTMNFGPATAETEACAIMDRAHEVGVNFFDTADIYGGVEGEGITERIVGRWFSKGGGRRERTVVATKVFGKMAPWPNECRLSALHIRQACDASLRRLQTDYIDIYQMHHVDRGTPWEEIWEAMAVLREQGKILYVGSSNFAGWHIAKAQGAAAQRQFMGLVCEQSLYNLMVREIELEVIPAAVDYGLGIIAWSPLYGGILAGALRKEPLGQRRLEGRAQETLSRERKRIEAYEQVCDDLGEEPAIIALSWVLHQPGLTAPIIGPRTVEQLDKSLRALEFEFTPAALSRLDDIFPGHKPAPEDYAW
jgi:aryl-alcohol dehydrogenase-like predicted oxidoreductase